MLQDSLFKSYCQLLEKVDRFCSALIQKHYQNIRCRRGCTDCCIQDLSLLPVEFHFLQQGLDQNEGEVLGRASPADSQCALLHQGACRQYQRRPIICRTHGLPLLVSTDSGGHRDCCPKNFKGRPVDQLPETDLLHLERLNTILVAVNAVFCRDAGLNPNTRQPISALKTGQAGETS